MYAMNFEFQFWFDMSKILAYISREPQKLLYVLQWGEQVSEKQVWCIWRVIHSIHFNKKCVCQQDPESPGRSPETPVRESGESGIYPGVSRPSESDHRKTVTNQGKNFHPSTTSLKQR